MSRKHKKNRQQPHPSKTPHNWTQEIFSAARAANKGPPSFGNQKTFTKPDMCLGDLISHSLNTGTDKHVIRALEDLEEENLDEAVFVVKFLAETASCSMDIGIHSANGIRQGTADLFIVPMLLIVQSGHQVPLSIPDASPEPETPSPLDLCTHSLYQDGLLEETPVTIFPQWLYTHDDLPESWAQRRSVVRQCAALATGQPAALPEPKSLGPTQETTAIVRFAIIGVIYANSDDPGPLVNGDLNGISADEESTGNDLSAGRLLDPRLLAWRVDMEEILAASLPGVNSVRLGTPAEWDDAIHEGFMMRNLFALSHAFSKLGQTEDSVMGDHGLLASAQVAVGFYMVDDHLEIRVGISEGDQFTGCVWECHLEPEEEMEKLFDTLNSIGISAEHIHVTTDILGDERCEGCGQTLFPRADGGLDHADNNEEEESDWDRPPPRLH
ncbi:DUF2863 family protein [Acidithiobacillus ferrivorans]|nr:DUF2863 family protein [Acidithiobacillus ferrivorans]